MGNYAQWFYFVRAKELLAVSIRGQRMRRLFNQTKRLIMDEKKLFRNLSRRLAVSCLVFSVLFNSCGSSVLSAYAANPAPEGTYTEGGQETDADTNDTSLTKGNNDNAGNGTGSEGAGGSGIEETGADPAPGGEAMSGSTEPASDETDPAPAAGQPADPAAGGDGNTAPFLMLLVLGAVMCLFAVSDRRRKKAA